VLYTPAQRALLNDAAAKGRLSVADRVGLVNDVCV